MNTRAFGWSVVLLVAIAIALPDFGAAQPACQPGRYASSATGSCEPCDVGRYQPALGQESCFPCEPGRFQDQLGRASCDACAAGRFQDASAASTCQDCAAGSARDATGQTSCAQCGPGRFSPAAGATVCDTCAPGRFGSTGGQTSCETCAPGRYATTDGSSTCRACDPGRYATTDGLESCASCGPGKFSGVAGATVCDSCEPGKFSGATTDALGQTNWASTCTSPNAFSCYKTKDLKYPVYHALGIEVTGAYGDTMKVKGPAMVCAPVDLGSGVEDPSGRQCCYKVTAPGLPKPHPQVRTSGGRFTGSALEVLKSQLICEPCGADPLP